MTLAPPRIHGPFSILANFCDNIYLLNMATLMASIMQIVILQLWKAM